MRGPTHALEVALSLSLVLGAAASASAAGDRLHAVTEEGALLLVEGVGDGPIAKMKLEMPWSLADVAVDAHGRVVASGTPTGGGPMLALLEPGLGLVTPIASTTVVLDALAFDSSGRLWGLGADSVLRRYHPTTGALLNNVPLNATLATEALALADDGTLYVATTDTLLTIDTATGNVETVGPFGLPGIALGVRGLDFGPDGALHAVADGFYAPSILFDVDRVTGAATLVGPIEETAGVGVRGIAFDGPGGVGSPGQGLGENHDLVLSWIPGSGGSGVLLGYGAPAWAPGMIVAGLDSAQVSAGGFSFLVDTNVAVFIPVPLDGEGTVGIPVGAAVLGAVDVVFTQLLSVEEGVIHASNRVEIEGGLGGVSQG